MNKKTIITALLAASYNYWITRGQARCVVVGGNIHLTFVWDERILYRTPQIIYDMNKKDIIPLQRPSTSRRAMVMEHLSSAISLSSISNHLNV